MAVVPLAAPAAAAVGRAAAGVGARVAGSLGRAGSFYGIGNMLSSVFGGSGGSAQQYQNQPVVDDTPQEERMRQLTTSGVQPSAVSGNEFSPRNNSGFADASVLQILRSIDTNIRSLRDSFSQAASPSYRNRASSRNVMGRGDVGSFALGILGMAAGAMVGNQPGQDQRIAGPENSSEQELNQRLNITPGPEVSSNQRPDQTVRQSFQQDISQLTTNLSEIRQRANQFTEENRNPDQNSMIARQIASAEGSLRDLSTLYSAEELDNIAIREVRRNLLARLSSIVNLIDVNQTPNVEQQRQIQDATPDQSQNGASANDATPSNYLLSSIDTKRSILDVVQTPNVEQQRQIQDATPDQSQNGASANDATPSNYLLSSIDTKRSILDVVPTQNNFETNMLEESSDRLARKISTIETSKDSQNMNPIIINAGQQAAPTVVPMAGQQNAPVPQPGTGAIILGYKSHPMMASEPRSPTLISHP